jgi:hypothetical protein
MLLREMNPLFLRQRVQEGTVSKRRAAYTSLAGAYLISLSACTTPGVQNVGAARGEPYVSADSRDEGRRESEAPAKVQVMLPDERVPCPFEALGTVTIEGPFVLQSEHRDPTLSEVLTGMRDKLGRQAAILGADGALVRRLLYDRRQSASRSRPPIHAVEALLLHYTEPDCAQTNP